MLADDMGLGYTGAGQNLLELSKVRSGGYLRQIARKNDLV
jgi:hypothetical protein